MFLSDTFIQDWLEFIKKGSLLFSGAFFGIVLLAFMQISIDDTKRRKRIFDEINERSHFFDENKRVNKTSKEKYQNSYWVGGRRWLRKDSNSNEYKKEDYNQKMKDNYRNSRKYSSDAFDNILKNDNSTNLQQEFGRIGEQYTPLLSSNDTVNFSNENSQELIDTIHNYISSNKGNQSLMYDFKLDENGNIKNQSFLFYNSLGLTKEITIGSYKNNLVALNTSDSNILTGFQFNQMLNESIEFLKNHSFYSSDLKETSNTERFERNCQRIIG